MAQAICAFFETWQPETRAGKTRVLADCMDDLDKGANLVFYAGQGVRAG